MLRKIIHITLLLSVALILSAQENHFSQFYSAPQYINPAFAGDAAHIKAGGAVRLMQPLPNQYVINTLIHYDHKIRNQSNGLGFVFYNHTEQLSHSKFQLNYSHTIRLSKTLWLKAGLGASVNQRKTSTGNYYYPDQYNNLGLNGNPTMESNLNDNSVFPGLATGLVLYNKLLWVSLSGDYLNKPEENFAGQNSFYPMKFSFMTGMLFPLNKTTSKRRFSRFGGLDPYSSLGPILGITKQASYVEYSGGLAYHLKPVFGGIHYRHQHDYSIDDKSKAYRSVVLMAGYRQEEFSFTYSYDYSLSKYSVNRSGAHEISFISYFSSWKNDEKRYDMVPLPNQLLY